MRDKLKAAADANGRSMNAEMIDLLQHALDDRGGPTREEVSEVIHRQNEYIVDLKSAMAELSRAAEFAGNAAADANALLEKEREVTLSTLRRVLDYIHEIPPALTIWVDHMVQILDMESGWTENAEEENLVLYPNAPENAQKVRERLSAIEQRHNQHMTERMKEIVARYRENTERADRDGSEV